MSDAVPKSVSGKHIQSEQSKVNVIGKLNGEGDPQTGEVID